MKLETVKSLITSKVGRQALLLRKHSPSILFVGGVIGVVGTAVLASRATLKLDDILSETKTKLDIIDTVQSDEYSEEDRQRDKAIVYIRTVTSVARVYAPAVGLGVLSIAALTSSHIILNRRNAAITAAYALLDKGFREYRSRVEAAFGPEREQEIRYGVEKQKFTVKDEDGKEHQETVKVRTTGSIYARCFDETNQNYSKMPNHNQFFLASQQQFCNDKLRAQGHLFLNEVYDMLGFERSPAGAVVGWIYDVCDNPDHMGDNFVDFKIFEGDRESGLRFVKGIERSVWLDFNVDGIIYDKI